MAVETRNSGRHSRERIDMEGLPKECWECTRKCGGEYMPAAWAIYDQTGGYWLCDKCYQKHFPKVVPTHPSTYSRPEVH